MGKEDAFLADLLDRVAAMNGRPVFFSREELAEWPEEVVRTLQEKGFLRKAPFSRTTPCDGCEEQCVMPVHVPAASDSAYIICDRRDDVHRIEIPAARLRQWTSSLKILASAIARLLELRPSSSALLDDGRRANPGVLRGHRHSSHVDLLINDNGQLLVSLAGHEVPLIEILRLKGNTIVVDRSRLMHLADNPAGPGGGRETAKERRKRLRKRVEELKDQGVRGFLKLVASEEGISVSTLKGIIYRKGK